MSKVNRRNAYHEASKQRAIKKLKDIIEDYQEMCKKHPEWRHAYILEKLAEKYYMNALTVQQIVTGSYASIRKYKEHFQEYFPTK